jgi:hypothetical protein
MSKETGTILKSYGGRKCNSEVEVLKVMQANPRKSVRHHWEQMCPIPSADAMYMHENISICRHFHNFDV